MFDRRKQLLQIWNNMGIVNGNGSYQKYPFIMINKILKWQFPNTLSPRAEKETTQRAKRCENNVFNPTLLDITSGSHDCRCYFDTRSLHS